jgi:hypothetical protein
VAQVAVVINYAHPFREGNGRTYKLFLAHIAEQSPYSLDFDRVTPSEWNYGFQLSMPHGREQRPLVDPVRNIVHAIVRSGAVVPNRALPTNVFGITYLPTIEPVGYGIDT